MVMEKFIVDNNVKCLDNATLFKGGGDVYKTQG